MPPANLCRAVWLGDMEYLEAYDLQLSLVEKVHSGQEPNTLLMLEHPHVYTKGRLSKQSDVLLPEDVLAARGIPVYETDRGGQVTYHGPGQLVAYPIVNLKDWGGPVKYVRTLEQVIIAVLAGIGIDANGEPVLATDDDPLQASLQHVALTFDPINGRQLYINGERNEAMDPATPGLLSTWDDTFALVADRGGLGGTLLHRMTGRGVVPRRVPTDL